MGQVELILPMIDVDFSADNTKSKEILGMEYKIDLKQTIIDMGYSLIEKGLVPDLRKSK